jgi:hypothetical protein
MGEGIAFNKPMEFNFEICFGDETLMCFEFQVNKTFVNRIRYWLLCQFFPFKIRRWD